jgi:hypothetical protein
MRRSPLLPTPAAFLVLLGCFAGTVALPGPPETARAVELATGHSALVDYMRKQPYLIYPGDPTQMKVLWQLTATQTSTIEWGTDTTYALGSAASVEYGTDHQHAHTIDGLTPGTRYCFRITTDGVAYKGSFTAAPDPTASRVKFFAYGDTRTYGSVHNLVASGMISAYTADPEYQTFTLHVGDYVGNGDSESDWTNQFFNPAFPNIRAFMADIAYQGCMGNHEGTGVLFVKYFPYPFVGGRYWSFDYGPVHVVIVDQYTGYATGSPQYEWIEDDLAASSKVWKFVVLHEPGWSAGGGHPNSLGVQNYIQPLCEQYDVSILFAGHNHYYARAVVNDVQHVTTGGGGAPLATPDPGYPYVVATAGAYHFCKIAVDGYTLTLKAVNTSGVVVDSFTIQRPDLTPPSVTLTSPVGGEEWEMGSAQTVTWSASDLGGVDSVNVDYSLTGAAGPWLPVAHGLANSGSTPWTLPTQPSDSALVRVTAFDPSENAGSDSSHSLFRIVDPTAGVGMDARYSLALCRAQPDPSRGSTLLRFSLPAAGRAQLEILDLAGRRLWRAEADLPAGAHAWHWDGGTLSGPRAGPGLYFVRLVTPWGIRTGRLVRLQ